MPELFLHLARDEQAEILRTLAGKLGRAPEVLEKDVWVCWTLRELFSMPGRLQMAFKGGTSLSKVFGAIHRFSEDVDVTLDHRALAPGLDPFTPGLSNTQIKRLGNQLRELVREHTTHVVRPYFETALSDQFPGQKITIDVDETGEKLSVPYPSAFDTAGHYVRNIVLLEFGGRNTTEPHASHVIRPDIAAELPDLEFPVAKVDTLSPVRTFWEKATLIHVECNRGELSASAERLSRHWYDLAELANQDIGVNALRDRALLADVVKHKRIFFDAPHANYDACLANGMRLVSEKKMLEQLEADYRKMIDAGMFYEAPPSFSTIMENLAVLEKQINR